MKIIKLFIVLLFCLTCTISNTQSVYHIDSIYPVHPLDQYLLVLEDSTNELSIGEVISDPKFEFHPLTFYKKLLNRESTYWGALSLHSNTSIQDWLLHLEQENQSIGSWGRGNSKVDVWVYLDGIQIGHKKTGTSYPKSEREIKPFWNQNRVEFDINAEDTLQLYIKVEANNFGFPPYFNLVLRSPKFQKHHPFHNKHTLLNKVLLGALLILILYYMLSYFYLKDEVFIWFLIWLFFSTMTTAINTDIGLVNEYLAGNFPGLQLYLWSFFSNSVWFTFWLFGRVFIGTKEKFPLLDKFILGLIILIFIESLMRLILIPFPMENRQLFFIILNAIEILFKVFGLGLAIILSFKKDRLSRYFGIGAILANLAPIIGILWVTGILTLSFDPFVWGVILQMIAYSFGLVYRKQLKNIAFKKSQLDLISAERASLELQRKVEIDGLKSKFFANISHEFRTPLSLILGPLKLAKKENVSDISISQKTYEMIERNTERLKELVDQLLDLSKIESGQTDVRLTQGGMIQFIKPIALDFESIASQKNITYNRQFESENNEAFYDKDKLQKIIHNLLSNAFKFTPEGKTVNFRCQTDDDYLTLEIEDTGSGIQEDQINKIFDRFYRTETTESKGSGIGLALTKELVELLNGEINVKSKVGIGTSFQVVIPIRINLLPKTTIVNFKNQHQSPDEIKAQEILEENILDVPTVLIIEDNEDLRTYISEILSPYYTIINAEDGEVGERLSIEHIPNIVISDVMMPKKDGYELCRAVKSNVITSHIPVILLTAKAGQKNKMSGLAYGADAYMTKPFDAEELLVRVGNFIEARQKIWNQFKAIGGTMIEGLSLGSIDDQFFQKIHSEIQDNLSNEHFSVEDLAQAVNFSRSQLHRKLKSMINKSASQLIRETRLNAAKLILEKKTMTVSETAYAVGFSNLSYFTKAFKAFFGFNPSDLK